MHDACVDAGSHISRRTCTQVFYHVVSPKATTRASICLRLETPKPNSAGLAGSIAERQTKSSCAACVCRHNIYVSQPVVVSRKGAVPLGKVLSKDEEEVSRVEDSVAAMKKVLRDAGYET